jgi:aminoglycoside 6'-N-acetyltransferase-1b
VEVDLLRGAQEVVAFRPLSDDDLPMLHEWLLRPHVSEWWGRGEAPPTIDEIRSEYLARSLAAANVSAYIACSNGRPIGFIQAYVAVDSGDGWWTDQSDPAVRGIDQFLCDADCLGRGLGTRMITAFVRKLFAEPDVARIQTDPSPDNRRAIRCYEKCGFERIREVLTPDGRAMLMVRNRDDDL